MIHTVINAIAVACYLAAALYEGLYLLNRSRSQPSRPLFFALGGVAVLAHGWSAINIIDTGHGIDLGFFRVLSLVFWFVCLAGLLNNLRRPLESALALLFPLAALSVLVSVTFRGPDTHLPAPGIGMLSHIILSILAYSLFALGALQALVLALQERELKHRRFSGVLNALPPLQTMEVMLFELLWVGFILLSLAIVSGAVSIENLFAQHLVHKTVFSLISWLVFAILLWGHHRLGWRGHTAVRWTLVGFSLLVLGFFGSKFVLELILHRGG
jgi:ABC-type uncharacterized transport system permease subunit